MDNEFNSEEHEIFNCAEDRNDEQGNISNSKLKSLGFIFDEYDQNSTLLQNTMFK